MLTHRFAPRRRPDCQALPRPGGWRGLLGLIAVAAFAGACTNAYVEPLPEQSQAVDDHLTLHTKICTDAPDPSGFPVKVLFIVDESGSMCVSDPPGSQPLQTSICNQYCAIAQSGGFLNLAPGCATNNPKPARTQALQQILDQFSKQNALVTNGPPPIQVAIVPFETNVFKNIWPPQTSANSAFYAPPDGTTTAYIDALQSELGNGTDYQGVLGYAFTQMAHDMAMTQATNAGALPRSRYVIVWITDGTPYPRCTATRTPDGGLPSGDYANDDPFNKPYLTWDDDPVDYCLESVGKVDNGQAQNGNPPGITGYAFGTDRNQNYQIFDLVNQIMSLKAQYNVGDINFDTILTINALAVQNCGPPCIDLYGDFPNLSPNQESAAALSVGTWLLSNMSQIGNGVFQAFTNGQISSLSLAGLDYSSFAAQNVLKSLFVQSLTSIPSPTGRVLDSDGEGLPDSVDNLYTDKTSPYVQDSDLDCFDDKFEVDHKTAGFDPAVPDPRGCLPSTGCVCTDTDGDGLSQYAEAYLGTNPGVVDSDTDGIPDGLEVRYGFNPTHHDNFATQDTDGDGISDLDEFMANTDPTVADAQLYSTDGYHYAIVKSDGPNDTLCYDITVTNLKLLPVPSQNGTDGFNLFKIWFDEAPSSVLNSDYGVWKVACAWAQYNPPNLRVPEGPVLDLTTPDGTNNWHDTDQLSKPSDYLSKCAGVAP